MEIQIEKESSPSGLRSYQLWQTGYNKTYLEPAAVGSDDYLRGTGLSWEGFDGLKEFHIAGYWDLQVSIVTVTSADLQQEGSLLALMSDSGTGKLVSSISYQ